MRRYILLHASKLHPGCYQYVPLDFSFNAGGDPIAIDFVTKTMAKYVANKLNTERAKYPPLYAIGDFTWTWDALHTHPDYEEYMGRMKEYRRLKKELDRVPAYIANQTPLVKPKPPLGKMPNVGGAAPAPKYITFNPTSTTISKTSDEYVAMAMQVTDLAHKVEVLDKALKGLADSHIEDNEDQTKALVAFGGILKGLDDRLEDLEHNKEK